MPELASPGLPAPPRRLRKLELRQLGRISFADAWTLQQSLEARRKAGEICDQLLLLEHPHVLTLGRNGHIENMLVGRQRLAELGIEFVEINRGGDITYHGPGQIVGYPIVDLREWKRDVVAYVRGLEETVIRTLARLRIEGRREPGATGVWVQDHNGQLAKICAIGVHISRWVTTHGFAFNWTTDLSYFRYIVPCGLTRPVTSLEALGVALPRAAVEQALVEEFVRVFDYDPPAAAPAASLTAA
jgi:lipoyl(octanoyl) transferase